MKFSKLDLLTLLISLFLFASCNKSSTIGLDLDPEDAIIGDLVETPVRSITVLDDPAVTYGGTTNPARLPFGLLTDPVFGTTEASLAMSVSLPSAAYSFGTNADIDSAVLVLPYATGFYGDTTTTVYSIDVKQLTNNIANESSFLSNKAWPSQTEVNGNFTGKIKPNTPFKVTSVVSGGPDTLAAVPASIRIKLNNTFVQDHIMNLRAAQLVNSTTFKEAFKGLHVNIKKESTTGTGGIMFFNFAASGANLQIYYRKQNETTATARDTVSVNFPIGQTTGPVAATIKHDYTGTDVATQLADTTQQYDVTYVQSLSGVRTKVSFPDLKALSKSIGGKIVINKAELVVDLSAGTDVSPFTPAQRLALYQYDIAGQRTLIQDQSTTDPRYTGNFGTAYDSSKKNYRFIVTAYIQDLIDGKTTDFGTYLAPAPSLLSEYNIASPIIHAERAVIGSYTNGSNKMKLNIYYTKY